MILANKNVLRTFYNVLVLKDSSIIAQKGIYDFLIIIPCITKYDLTDLSHTPHDDINEIILVYCLKNNIFLSTPSH